MHLLSNPFILFAVTFIVLWCCEVLYFKLAYRFNIIDKPNQRSSHMVPTIRGGGIIFVIAVILWYLLTGFQYSWFLGGMLLIAFISFLDDIQPQPASLRSALQLIAFLLMLVQMQFFSYPWWLVGIVVIIAIGSINAFNFMDGINGITGVYAAVNLLTFCFIDRYLVTYTERTLILAVFAGVIVFLFYNFRKKARCFAGDVGSVSLAFVQIFLLLQLIDKTQHFGWILLFLVYGTDSVVTIIYRLMKRENIFKAHRTHLYQYLSNELGYTHLSVSALYGAVQLMINIAVISLITDFHNFWFPLLFALLFGLFYLSIRVRVLKLVKERIGNY